MLSFLRTALLIAVIWRHAMSNWLTPSFFGAAEDAKKIITAAIIVAMILYSVFTVKQWNARNKKAIDIKPGAHTLPDIFFLPSLIDLGFVIIVGILLPGHFTEVHLGFLVAFAASWLFKSPSRIGILWAVSAIGLVAHWWLAWYLPNSADNWRIFCTQTIPRVLFWFAVAAFMVITRIVRRNQEEQALFFSALAESLPFDVFVKDNERRFLYANEKLLKKLSCACGFSPDLCEVQSKTDSELGIDASRSAAYEEIDTRILNGEILKFHDFEKSYDSNVESLIETIKVPIIGINGSPVYILGLCSNTVEDDEEWFFRNMVAVQQNHCFFVVENESGVRWVNESYLDWIKKDSVEQIKGKSHADLFDDPWAAQYSIDDKVVLQGSDINREEWNKPKNGILRRVQVVKKPVIDYTGEIIGVRGYFVNVHRSYLRKICRDYILKCMFNAWLQLPQKINKNDKEYCFFVLVYICRLLNVGALELNQSLKERVSKKSYFKDMLKPVKIQHININNHAKILFSVLKILFNQFNFSLIDEPISN